MPESRLYSSQTKSLILKYLGLSRLEDIWARPYQDLTLENDARRELMSKFARRYRGSVRLSPGRFYTAREFHDRIAKSKQISLP